MIPLIRARPGIRIPELAHIFGVRESEIWEDITEILSLCGVPPYLPHNYLVFGIHGDRVTIRFAEHLARPVHRRRPGRRHLGDTARPRLAGRERRSAACLRGRGAAPSSQAARAHRARRP